MGKKFVFLIFAVLLMISSAYAACDFDSTCDTGENKCNCSDDCGICGGSVEGQACRQYSCVSEQCVSAIMFNCCGNDICESRETFASCDDDCAPKHVSVELLEFEDIEYYRGDHLAIKVSVYADEIEVKKATVHAMGFFGELRMYDDGNHSDNYKADGVYGNRFTIGEGVEEGNYLVTVEASKKGVIGTRTLTVTVNPLLGLEISPGKSVYTLGDVIELTGFLSKREEPLSENVTVRFISNGKSIFSATVKADENGAFSLSRHTSLIDPAGEWLIEATATDENNNAGFSQQSVNILTAEGTGYLDVEFIEPVAKAFNRGEEVDFLVRIEDLDGEPVEEAGAEIAIYNEIEIQLRPVSPGNYAGKFSVPLDFPLGEQGITAIVSKEIGGTLYSGFNETNVFINMAPIDLQVVSPTKSTFKIGESIDFRLRLLYDNARPVEHAKLDLNLNGKIMRAKEKGDGYYTLEYAVPDENFDEFRIVALVEDGYGNLLEQELDINIKPEPYFLYFLTGNPVLLAAIIVAILIAVVFVILVGKNVVRLRLLTRKKIQLIELKKKLQHQYFNQGTLGSNEYYALLDKYNGELEKIETMIKFLEKK